MKHLKLNVFLGALTIVVLSEPPSLCRAQAPAEPAFSAPLLVLLAAKDETSMAVERQLVGELRLTLDSLQVEQVVIEREDFLDLTLPAQLAVVQPLIRRFMARAVVWITIGTNGGRLVQFVVTDRGNSTIRTVEAGSPEELALAVRELLDTSYLFEDKAETDNDSDTDTALFSVGASLAMNGGMYGHKGSSLCGGMGIEGRFNPIKGLFVGLGTAFKIGPGHEEPDGILSGWRMDLGVFGGYLFYFGRFGIGPYGEITAFRSSLSAVLGEGDWERYAWWSFRGALGLATRLRLSSVFSIIINWTVGGISRSHIFERESSGSGVLATPIMDYAFSFTFVTGIL